MFKPARWWSEKNRIKVVFKLQFHASQVTEVGGDGLMISVVPGDSSNSKPSVRSDKAAVREGRCLWENPIHETVKFNRDPKSGKIHQRIYYFIIGTGSSKSGFVGEASIDFSSYAEASKVSLVSLPLKNSNSEAILHVSIQRVHESMDQREMEENGNASSQLGDDDVDGSLRVSSGSGITLSSYGSSSGLETQSKKEHHRRSWEWLGDSAIEDSLNDTKPTPVETFLVERSEQAMIERLRADVSALSRQAEMSELELHTLRKLVVKESKRGQDLWREVVCLKEERDGLKRECQQPKAYQKSNELKTETNSLFDGVDSQSVIEELRQELNHANELNTNLRVQLQKTQESNSQLILAVQDLEQMLEQKNEEIPIPLSRSLVMDNHGRSREVALDNEDEDEQKALEDVVKKHNEAQESLLLEQEIVDLQTEIEKDELEMQLEQIALDYEIMKQANHDMAIKLEQSEIHEQLEMQYECSSVELGTRIESLEKDLQGRTKEYENSLVTISELQEHVRSLEKELEMQAQGFEADVEALTRSRVLQEQRAIRAEETLKKMRWKNANAAERLQDELKKLSAQMASTFEANEKSATKALAEAHELRLQKIHLEAMLQRISEEHQSVEGLYEARLQEVNSQVKMMTDEKIELESRVILMKTEAEEMEEELNKMRSLVKEKELTSGNLHSELDSLRARFAELQHSVSADELEKEILKKQVVQFRERIKLLEGEIKVKETALEKSANTYLEREEILHRKIEELEGMLEVKQSYGKSKIYTVSAGIQPAADLEDQASNCRSIDDEARSIDENSSTTSTASSVNYGPFLSRTSNDFADDEVKSEMALAMERELKEMQERYSDMSLKFAEVESERQQLVMKLRNLTNAKNSSHSTNLFAPVF